MVRILFSILVAVSVLCGVSVAGQKTVVLASLDWPPYSGPELFRDGASAEVVRAAFREVGYEVEIRYYPWKRAMQEARTNLEVDGYFPEYFSEDRADIFQFSDPIGKSPLGFVESSQRPTRWTHLEVLSKYRIGVVQGYVNSAGFDYLVSAGVLDVDASVSDVINLRKVVNGRLDMAVVDSNVLEYFINTDHMLRENVDKLRMNPRLLAIHDLFVAFRKGAGGERLVQLFNQGLRRVKVMDVQRQYIESLGE